MQYASLSNLLDSVRCLSAHEREPDPKLGMLEPALVEGIPAFGSLMFTPY